MQVTHHKTYYTTWKKLRYRSGTGQIYRYWTGTGTSPNFTGIGTGIGTGPEFRSGPSGYPRPLCRSQTVAVRHLPPTVATTSHRGNGIASHRPPPTVQPTVFKRLSHYRVQWICSATIKKVHDFGIFLLNSKWYLDDTNFCVSPNFHVIFHLL